jgi:hypothetical protein
VLAVIGVLLAVGLAFLSYFKVDGHGHLSYRAQQVWRGQARLLVIPRTRQSPTLPGPNTVVEAEIYSALVNSDSVTRSAFERFHSGGGRIFVDGVRQPLGIAAQVGYNVQSQATLPIMIVTATAPTRRDAALLTNSAATALSQYMIEQQKATGVAVSEQVRTQWLNAALPQTTTVASPRSKTRPVLAFVLIIAATLGLIMLLENVRPRLRQVSSNPVASPNPVVSSNPVQISGRRESSASSSSS